MTNAKSLGLKATLVILWVSLAVYPAFRRHFEGRAVRPEAQRSIEPGLFVPLLGAWTLPESPLLRFRRHEDTPERR
jgi:hypothetical protein